jgi:presequence protease
MKVGDVFSDFQLKSEQYIDEIKSVARIFEHKKSGARLLHLENDDDNKVFSIAFKTPSYDDTGVSHILEHSVLCGSKNFPTKEPFLELIKSSLQTFLNAMTYPDKTIYPIASRNDKDFFNLMHVYLDAVFYPNIYEKPEIFMQEGWHYHLEGENEKLFLNGVVYSEMKGSYSSPERILDQGILSSLYPDTSYTFSSGGKPEAIPKLTYEKFLEFHKKYYHPSNSYIYLYGNGDIKSQLQFLDEKYLSSFDKQKLKVSLGEQKSFKEMQRSNLKYSVSKDEQIENKTYFSLNYSCGLNLDTNEKFALKILMYYLMGTKSAPLKKILLEENIGEHIFGHFEDDVMQPYISLYVKNSNLEKEEKFLRIVEKTLQKFVSEGLNKDLLEACINTFEFDLREADYDSRPKGLYYNLDCLKTWLYGEDPLEYITYEKKFKDLRNSLEKGFFEKLLEKYFLKNTHCSLVVLEPEQGLLGKKEKELQAQLDSYRENLSMDELKKLVKKTLNFKKFQKTPDSLEDINKIPKLKIEDVKKEVEEIPTEKEKVSDIVFLHNPLNTNGICYLKLAFDTKTVPFEKLYSLNVLSLLLGRVATKKYTYEDLDVFVQKYTGGIAFKRTAFVVKDDDSKYTPKIVVKGKVFNENFSKLVEILLEIVCESKFDEKGRIREIIQEARSKFEMNINSRGNHFAVTRLLSYFSEYGKYDEYTNGISYYKYLNELLKDFDKKWPFLKKDLEYLQEIVFNKTGLVANIVYEEKEYANLKSLMKEKLANLKVLNLPEEKYKLDFKNINEGLLTQNSVQNVAMGNNFKLLGYEYSGKLLVLKNIISRDYLWEELRVQGGAYGANCTFNRKGWAFFSSYRDPNLIRTLASYEKSADFLKNFKTENMDKFVVSTTGSLDMPLTPSMKGEKALSMYLSGIANEDLQKEREEVLSTTVEDIRGFSELVRALFKEKYYCVLGNEGVIKENKDLFDSLISVHK